MDLGEADPDTEELLARLSRGVDQQLARNAAPSSDDPTGEFLQRLLLEAGADTGGDNGDGDWDEGNLYHRLNEAASQALAEHRETIADTGVIRAGSRAAFDAGDGLANDVLFGIRQLLNSEDDQAEPDFVGDYLRGGARAASARPATNRHAPPRAGNARDRRARPRSRSENGPGEPPGPRAVNVPPPSHAKTYYKVVAMMEGRPMSIYDGVTEYAVGQTIKHPHGEEHSGGLYVSETIQDCLRRDKELFPSNSVLLNAPRCIAKVLAWNRTRVVEPARYGSKLAFTYVRTIEILPYPQSWPADRAERRALHRDNIPRSDHRLHENWFRWQAQEPVIGAPRRADTLLRAQAATIELEEEVAEMERRLAQRTAGA